MSDATALTPYRHLERVAIEVAGLAADFARNEAGRARTAHTKSSPTDVVTHTDLATEQLIRSELIDRAPGSSILGEEFDQEVGSGNVGWIVDPIDGTVNFLYDLPVVSVSIAATLDGKIVAGAVADLHRGDIFSASVGGGARRSGDAITASTVTDLGQALVATGFSYDAEIRAEQSAVLTRLLPACRDIRCMGSAALNLCWVGCGRVDAYFERNLKLYDHAAGALVATEAGARIEAPRVETGNVIVAAAPGIDAALRSVLGR